MSPVVTSLSPIAAAISPQRLSTLAQFAKALGLEVLMEVHDETELKSNLNQFLDVVGVNNRNLKTFETSIETSKDLAALIPDDFLKISESGISEPESILELRAHGFKGFLIGETFMKTARPESTAAAFIEQLKKLEETRA